MFIFHDQLTPINVSGLVVTILGEFRKGPLCIQLWVSRAHELFPLC